MPTINASRPELADTRHTSGRAVLKVAITP